MSPIITALGILRVRFQKIYCLHHWILLAKNQGFLASPVIRIRYVAFYEEFSSFQDIAAKEDPGWREYSSAQIVRYVCLSNWPSKGDVFLPWKSRDEVNCQCLKREPRQWLTHPGKEKTEKTKVSQVSFKKNEKDPYSVWDERSWETTTSAKKKRYTIYMQFSNVCISCFHNERHLQAQVTIPKDVSSQHGRGCIESPCFMKLYLNYVFGWLESLVGRYRNSTGIQQLKQNTGSLQLGVLPMATIWRYCGIFATCFSPYCHKGSQHLV